MRQYLAIVLAFLLVPFWIKQKLKFGPTLLVTAAILGILAGLDLKTFFQCFAGVFITGSYVRTILIVALVGVLCHLLKHYGILNKIETALRIFIPNKKVIMMILPATVGLLSVPGGAALSAPFVDVLGEEMNVKSSVRAVINLSFRHIAMFLLPFTNNMVFVSVAMPGIHIYHLILLNLGFVIVMQLVAYFLFVWRITAASPETVSAGKKAALWDLIVYLSPIYLVILFNGLFNLELLVSLVLCILWTFFLTDRKKILTILYQGINLETILVMVGVYFIRNIMQNLDFVMGSIVTGFQISSGNVILLLLSGAAILFGLTTGYILVPLGIILPIVSDLPLVGGEKLLYTYFVFVWSFLGYYFSPLHLCQVLTIKQMGCSLGEVYKENLKLVPFVVVASYVLFYLYQLILIRN